ncbi:MAG: PorP/SprF family type IX secretion system membrane protein, partial [Flavobacteriales bacterium]|nr:PorP/SprF family type IX secretion system membrane protein [Flavobacteriales bacterium]
MKRLIIIATFSVCAFCSFGQDEIFSRFDSQPLMLNPAFTGEIEEDYRASISYRNQWSSIVNAFKTSAASFEMTALRQANSPNHLGFGGYVVSDKAGASKLGVLKAMGSAAYHLGLNDNNALSAGVQVGYVQRSVTLDGLKWDSQFNGVGYDPSLATNETFTSQQ